MSDRVAEAEAVIANLRAQLDEVDSTLIALLRRRISLVLAVNFAKRMAGREVLDSERESDLLNRAAYAGEEVGRVYSRIITTCRELAQEHRGDEETPVPNPEPIADSLGPPKRPHGR